MTDVHEILRAAVVSADAHNKQNRKGNPEPYIVHPLRVAREAAAAGLSTHAVVAGLLHDVVEDTDVTLPDLHRHKFSAESLHMVDLLTKTWGDHAPEAEKAAKAPLYYGRIADHSEALAL